MKIDATQGDRGWLVYDCEQRRQVGQTVWVDDVAKQFAIGLINAQGLLETKTFEANKIVIVRAARVALINPPDGNPEVIALELRELLNSAAREMKQ